MKNFYKNYKNGFTLIEILVVIAVLVVIIGFSMVVDFSSFKGNTFISERDTIVSALQRARSRAMANLGQTTYGVCFTSPNYVIFKGPTCTTGENILANINATVTFPTIVFEQLTGKLAPQALVLDAPCLLNEKKISINYQGKVGNICINNEGTINW